MFVKPADINTNQTCPLLLLQASRVYNDVRQGEGQSRSPPVENSIQTSVVYTVVTAAASRPLSKVRTNCDLSVMCI